MKEFQKMTDPIKIQRIARWTLHCISNIACYRAGWNETPHPKTLRNNDDFWARANGNFLDAAVLNWCILFAEADGKHYWLKAFETKVHLANDLYQAMGMTESAFNDELLEVKRYRDKYLAHLDNPPSRELFYPETEFMLKSTKHLLETLKSNEQTKAALIGVYLNADGHYNEKYEEAKTEILASIRSPS